MNPAQLLENFDRISEAPDAVTRLRLFILNLAVRGKLVEQDPKDEPASELLKRIKAEQARLVKQGKIKEIKAFSTITANAPYKLPANWQWIPLGVTVNSHLGGGTPSKNNSTYWGGDIYWASVKDIGKGKYVDETIDRITEAGLADSSSNLIPPGNLIVVTRMGLGKLSINRVPIAINQDLRALSLSSLSAMDYYYNFFKTHGFDGTGLTVKGIKVEELMNTPFPLPPLAEQHRIVAKVDELMTLCNQLETAQNKRESRRDRLVAANLHRIGTAPATADEAATETQTTTLPEAARFHLDHLPRLTTRPGHIKQLRRTILNLAVRGHLVPQNLKDEPVAELFKRIATARVIECRRRGEITEVEYNERHFTAPEGWQWIRLGSAFSIKTGFAFKSSTYTDSGTLVFRVTNFDREGAFDLSDVKYFSTEQINEKFSAYLLEEGEIIMVMVGGTIGKTTKVTQEILPALMNQNMWRLRSFGRLLNNDYEYLLIRSINQQIETLTHSTHGHFAMSDYEKKPICIPPLAEQHRIVAKVDELMALCDRLETQLTTTQTDSRRLLEAVLHEALSPIHKEVA